MIYGLRKIFGIGFLYEWTVDGYDKRSLVLQIGRKRYWLFQCGTKAREEIVT